MLLAVGIGLTAMRTTLVAFAAGSIVVVWRAAASRRQRVALGAVVVVMVLLGAVAVWRTRATGALELRDASALARTEVVAVAARRVLLHPLLGHGMDAMHRHWSEWGFPGRDMLDAHSTPVQIAFDRGLPALAFWIWLMVTFWIVTARAERRALTAQDLVPRGLLLGVLGGLTGFLVSSLVNYNFGDSEVALLLWWMMGAVVVLARARVEPAAANATAIKTDG